MRARVLLALLGASVIVGACANLVGGEFDKMRLRQPDAGLEPDADADVPPDAAPPPKCEVGATRKCYPGPEGTSRVGLCHEGVETCDEEIGDWGECKGAITPAALDDVKAPGDENCDGRSGDHLWSRFLGGAGDQFAKDVDVDHDGNVYVVGSFQGQLDYGSAGPPLQSKGDQDIFVVKLGPRGDVLWARGFGSITTDVGYGIAVAPDKGVVLAGPFAGPLDFGGGELEPVAGYDVFVAKLDGAGEHVWSRRFGGADHEWAYDIAATPDGGAVLTGRFLGTMDAGGAEPLVSAGQDDIFLIRVDGAGGPVWQRAIGGPHADTGRGVHVDESGNVLLLGGFQGQVDFGGTPLIAPVGVDVGGTFALELDDGANHVWSMYLGDTKPYASSKGVASHGGGSAVLATSLYGTVVIGGEEHSSEGSLDVLLGLVGVGGVPKWSRLFSGQGIANGATTASDAFGDVAVAGTFTGSVDLGGVPAFSEGARDVFVVKLDGAGNELWSRALGDYFEQILGAVATDAEGNVVIAGAAQGKVDFGGDLLTSGGGYDVFVAKYSR